MTDMNIQGDVASTNSAVAPETGVATSVSAETPSNLQTLPQDRIDSIAKEAHQRGYSKAQRELQQQSQQQPQQPSGQQGFNPDDMRKVAAEEATKALQQAQMQLQADTIYGQFQQKMQLTASKYPDFAQKMNELDLSRMTDIIQNSHQFENVGDMMYDLSMNPMKIANIQSLLQSQPLKAQQELQKLSASIRANQSPAPSLPNSPLRQVNSSPIGTSSDGLPDWEYTRGRYKG